MENTMVEAKNILVQSWEQVQLRILDQANRETELLVLEYVWNPVWRLIWNQVRTQSYYQIVDDLQW
jgi:hypothetical protein